jgi:hypothetical protein
VRRHGPSLSGRHRMASALDNGIRARARPERCSAPSSRACLGRQALFAGRGDEIRPVRVTESAVCDRP